MRLRPGWRPTLVTALLVGAVACALPATAAAVPSTDLKVTADRASGTVGSIRRVDLHLYNLGPGDAPAGAITEEFRAPVGASLLGTYPVGRITPTAFPPGCTWVTKPTDIKCVRETK